MKLTEAQFNKSRDSLYEQKNTYLADINEILVGYYCAGGKWSLFGPTATAAKKVLQARREQVGEQAYADQDGRAKAQAQESLAWARANDYDDPLTAVFWTARPGDLSRAVGVPVDSRKNPTDILLQFGKENFLGISAKSTGGKADIGFKNPGLGSLAKILGLDFSAALELQQKLESQLDFGDAASKKGKKEYLKQIGAYPLPKGSRTPTKEGMPYYNAGTKVLRKIRDDLLAAYLDMPIDDLKEHFLSTWIDAKGVYPYYIKATGFGKNGNYSAKVEDPLQNEKLKKLSSEHIELEELASNSIGVWAGEGSDATKLFRIRLKWESAPLVSGIKLSGDPQ
tara:strand:+ start:1399 stop:2415 length:1017 start_codon:yes stop_codon:yes gene_type:complete